MFSHNSFFQGSYRTNLFHSELSTLVVSSIAFVLTAITLIVIFITRVGQIFFLNFLTIHFDEIFLQATRSKTDSIFSVANSVTSSVLTGFGGLILVIQLTRVSVFKSEKKSQKFREINNKI